MDYSNYLDGSPLIPTGLVVPAVVGVLAVLIVLLLLFHIKYHHLPFRRKLGFCFQALVGLCLLVVVVLASYLLPAPRVVAVRTDNQRIEVDFDRPVSRQLLERELGPDTPGVWLYENGLYEAHLVRRLVFYPDVSLLPATEYKVTLKNISNTLRTSKQNDYEYVFTTADGPKVAQVSPAVRLSVPAYLQKYSLSCEISSLRMALAYRGHKVSEDDLLAQLGTDPTPHVGNTWGDPNVAFVGNVRGRQMTTGYGVYWGPIARVARNYTNAREFEGGNVKELMSELVAGNPVIIWVYSKNGTPTSWNTPEGKKIYAAAGEHTVVAVGFVGSPDNPTKVIVNDSLVGQVYWSRATFDKKWKTFNNSGVVIY